MRFQKLFSDTDGESRWTDVDVTLVERSFAPPAQKIEISEAEPAKRMMFLRLRAGWDEPIHPTPVRQRLVCLSGAVVAVGAFTLGVQSLSERPARRITQRPNITQSSEKP